MIIFSKIRSKLNPFLQLSSYVHINTIVMVICSNGFYRRDLVLVIICEHFVFSIIKIEKNGAKN